MRLTDWLLAFLVVLLLLGGLLAEGYAGRGPERAIAYTGIALLGILAIGPGWRTPRAPAMFPVLFFLIPLGVGGLLTIPLPADLTARLSPVWATHFDALAAAGLLHPPRAPLGLDPEWGARALHQWFAAGVFLLSCLVLAGHRPGRWWLTMAVVAVGLVEGWLAFLALVLGEARASGALFNPNHSAALILLVLPAAGALVHQRSAPNSEYDNGENRGKDRWIPLMAVVGVAAIGWFTTLSRASLLVAVAVLGPWLLWEIYVNARRGRVTRPGWFLAMGVGGAAALLLTLWFTGATAAMVDRLESPVKEYGRVELWSATAGGLAESRFLGLGPGGAATTMERLLHDSAARRAPGWTHNDYLQMAAEFGALGCLLFLLWAAGGLRILGRLPIATTRWWLSRRNLLDRALLAGMLTILLHSLVDFPLRIPLVGFCFLAILAVFVSRLTRPRTSAPLPASHWQGPGGNPP